MIEVKEKYKKNNKLASNLKTAFAKASADKEFKALITNLKLKEEIAMKYTSKLEETVVELKNCKECKSIFECKNKIEGYILMPSLKNNRLTFSYAPCKYTKKLVKEKKSNIEKNALKITMKDIDITDKKRVKVIKGLKDFYTAYGTNKEIKGLYLHGSFGCGKTFLITALLNELGKKRIRSEIVYFPELIREFKGDFETLNEKMDYYIHVDILLIDDIGAEKVTEWSRDEILGTILQNRMNKSLSTFFTSNLSLSELETHLSISNNSDDAVKARRIIERIKQLTEDFELISANRRK